MRQTDSSAVWRWEAFAGEFADAFIKNTSLEGERGSYPGIGQLVSVVLEVLGHQDQISLLGDKDRACVRKICDELTRAADVSDMEIWTRQFHDADQCDTLTH